MRKKLIKITRRVRNTLLIVIWFAIGPLPLFSQNKAVNVTQLIQESQTALAITNFDEAARLARSAVNLDPAYPPAWRQLGLSLLHDDQTQEAVPAFQRAVAMDETDATAWRGLALAHWQANQQNEAIQDLNAYLHLKPDDATGWRDLAAWLVRLEHTDQALSALERVIELAPDDASAWRDLAMLHLRKGRTEEAAKEYEKALTFRPNDPAIQRDLGWVLWTLERREEAVTLLSNAIESGVDDRDRVIYQVVARLAEEGSQSEALAFLRRVNPSSSPSELGLVLARTGRLKAAEPILADAWNSGAKAPDIGLYLAYARAVNGLFTDIAEYLDPILHEASPLSPERADLALEVLRLSGTRPETADLAIKLENALDQKNRFMARVTDILETAAETYRVHEEPELSLQLYRRVLDRDPDRAGWFWAVSLAEKVEGQTPFAWMDAYEKRVAFNPARLAGTQGLRAARNGDTAKAIPELRQSVTLDPQQPFLRQVLFDSLLRCGQIAEARVEADWFAQQVELGENSLRPYWAEMLTRLGDYPTALAQWQLLHSAFPAQPYYGLETAFALYRLDRPTEAIDVLQPMAEKTHDHRVFELLAEIASSREHTAEAVEWAARGLAVTSSQGLLRYHAENLEKLGTDPTSALASATAFLKQDPGYVPLTLLSARMLEIMGDTNGVIQFHQRLIERNPAFVPSLVALRNLYTQKDQIDAAAKPARMRVDLQPNNPEALRQYAITLAQQDQFRKALDILRPLARTPLKKAVPVLVYQSITKAPYAGRNSVDQIGRHIQQLTQDGYAFINTFNQIDKVASDHRIMIVLIDPDPSVIEALDPILQQYHARVIYVGNTVNPALTLSAQPLPERVSALLANERWNLASGGPIDLRRQPINPTGALGNPLTHPVLMAGACENTNAYAARLERVLAESAGTLTHQDERIWVYPEGDFGQRSLDTTTHNLSILHNAVAHHFTQAIYFDDSGFFLLDPQTDSLRIPARIVPPEWDEKSLTAYLGSGHPLTRSRLDLGRVLYWHGQHEAANAAFASAKKAGADPQDVDFNWGLNADQQGDIPTALKKLRTAQELDPQSEPIQSAMERVNEHRRPQVDAFLQGWEDSENRSHFLFGVDGNAFVTDELRLGAFADRDQWKTQGVDPEEGTRYGLNAQAYLAPQIWLSGRLWQLEMDDYLPSHWGGEAALHLPDPLLNGYFNLTAGRDEIETVEALRENIDANIYAVRSYTRIFDAFDLFADLSETERTDNNNTTMLEGRLLYRVKEWPYWGVGWRFRFADSDFDPPEYWAPMGLEEHQAHINLRGTWGRLNGTLSGEFGYAREQDTDWRFVWGTRGEAEYFLTKRLSLSAQLGWFEGPVYNRLYGRAGLSARF